MSDAPRPRDRGAGPWTTLKEGVAIAFEAIRANRLRAGLTILGVGIGVSVVCPQYVATPLIGLGDADALQRDTLLTADDVAKAVMDGAAADRFLILPHPQVADYTRLRAADHDKWIAGMQALRGKVIDSFGRARPEEMYKLV